MLAVVAMMSFAIVEAKPADPKDEKSKEGEPEAWSDPRVQGIIDKVYWADGKDPKTKTATMTLYSAESDQEITIYGDNPNVREAIVNGTACVGRFAVVTGDRIDPSTMVGQGIEVPNLDMECTATLGPQ